MKINTNDIRQRLSENTAIDAKEIQALCDEVESSRKIMQSTWFSVMNSKLSNGSVILGDSLEGRIEKHVNKK